ncbi:7129_t:CDS:2 [Rhizophagus irregularis]|nr:7129_t:CDS:2 [Rhizophagus irregularis]
MFERKFQTTIRNGLAFRNPAFGMSRWVCTSEWWMQSRERRMQT